MQRYIPFFEKRSNSELNPHISAWDYLDKYKDDPDVYISFTEIDKIGINPRSKYNTPVGIYTYPLKELVKLHLNIDPRTLEREKVTNKIGDYVPFAGNAKYVNFIRVKDKSHFIEDMYKDYGSNDYDRDIKILENKYKNIIQESFFPSQIEINKKINKQFKEFFNNLDQEKITITYHDGHISQDISGIYISNNNDGIILKDLYKLKYYSLDYNSIRFIYAEDGELLLTPEEYIEPINELNYRTEIGMYIESMYSITRDNIWEEIVNYSINHAKVKNPIMSIWNFSRLLAQFLSKNKKNSSTKWNLILSKDLGYSGFADKSGKGYIHPSEPMQAVFFNTRAFDIITRVENIPAKKVASDEDNKKLKLAGLLNKSLNLGFNLQHLIKAIYFNGNKLELNFLHLWDDRIMIQGPQVKALSIPIHKIICGCLYISHTNLTSLKNIPVTIEGSLCITGNEKLTVLDYLPELVTNDLILDKRYKTKYGYTEDSIRELCNVNGNIRFL